MKFLAGERIPLGEAQFIDTDTARFYDEHARRFMGPIYRRFAAKAAGISLTGNRVLDIGTGSGRLAIELATARPDWRITGIDISEEMLKLARQNAVKGGLSGRVDFRPASAEALPFDDSYFNLVVSNASLHLWTGPLKVFQEIARVTAPGGYCLVRDNLRLGIFCPLLSLIGRGMGMNAAQSRMWLRAVRSSYTIGEVKALLKESPLKHARVSFNPGSFDLGIEWRKG